MKAEDFEQRFDRGEDVTPKLTFLRRGGR